MTKKKNPVGPPTKYKSKYCQELIDYFEVEYELVQEEVASQGKAVTITRAKLSKFPTLEGFCVEIGITKRTLLNWTKEYPELLHAYEIAKYKQKMSLMQGGLSGQYNSSFAKFVAINCTDMVDTQHIKSENETTVKEYGVAFDLSKSPDEIKKQNEGK
jgi:hypothetical protein